MRIVLITITLWFLSITTSYAATCYWVGGTGNFDNINTTSWSSSSGGSTGTCAASGGIPKNSADTAVFDGSSGGGTVTVCGASSANCPSASNSLNITNITMGNFGGTLTFATNNPNVTLSVFSNGGSGTRTLSMGSGTWTITGTNGVVWEISAGTPTLNHNSGTLQFTPSSDSYRYAYFGALTYNNIVVNPSTSGRSFVVLTAFTTANLTITGQQTFEINSSQTITITNTLSWTGLSSTIKALLKSSNISGGSTINVSNSTTLSWLAVQGLTKSGAGSITCSPCWNAGNNSNITFALPLGGTGIIGGSL